MTVSVVNYDNFSDCFEYRIITIIIITKGMRICFLGSRCRCHLSTATIVAAGLAVVGLNCCCSSGHAWLYFFIAPSRRADPWRPAAAARWLQCEGARKPKPMIVPQRGNCTHEHEILCAFSIFYASVPFDLVVVVVDCNFPPPPSSGWKYCSKGYEFIFEHVRFLPRAYRLLDNDPWVLWKTIKATASERCKTTFTEFWFLTISSA